MHLVIRSTIISFILEDSIVFLRATFLQRTSLVPIGKHCRTKDKLIKETIDHITCITFIYPRIFRVAYALIALCVKFLRQFGISDPTCCTHLLYTFNRVISKRWQFFRTELEFENIADFETREKNALSGIATAKATIQCAFMDTAPIETASQV